MGALSSLSCFDFYITMTTETTPAASTAPDYPDAVTGYAPSGDEIIHLREFFEFNARHQPLGGKPSAVADACRIAIAVSEANRAAAEAAHWSSKLATSAEPLVTLGQGEFTRTIPAE